jgi:hypothetical protein
MPAPHTRWRFHLTWLCLSLGAACPALAQQGDERLLSDAEIAGLERENALWRLVRPDEDEAANLVRIRAAGFTAEEVAAVEPRLAAMWRVPFERNFGWLRPETAEQIRAVDRQFIVRMRVTRLYATTGIRAGGLAPVKVEALNRLWRGAILRALDYDEIAEFRLMNSASAREEMRRVQGLVLTEDELRTLFVWRREYDARQVPVQPDARLTAMQQEARLDQWQRTRDLLGDERFVRYLERDHPGFETMRRALHKLQVTDASVALNLWWLRQKEGYVRNQEPRGPVRDELTVDLRAKVAALIGEMPLADYLADEDARWLVIRGRQYRPGSANVPPREWQRGTIHRPAQGTGTP